FERRPQRAVSEVRVDLRRGHRGVAEQLLDDAQVGAALQQVSRERVAQDMRGDGLFDADGDGVPAHDPEHALARDAATPRVEQECGRLLLLTEEWTPTGEIAAAGLGGEPA